MIRKETDFPFLCQRDYVHGTSVVSAIADLLEKEAKCLALLKAVKFLRPISSNGVLVIEPGDQLSLDTSDAACTFKARTTDRQWKGAFIEQGRPILNRISVEYDLDKFTFVKYGGRCLLRAQGRAEFIRAFVEANKRFHLYECGAGATVRFGYLENWQTCPIDNEFIGFLEAKNLIVQHTKGGFRTINRLTYSDKAGSMDPFEICFDIELPGENLQ